MTQEPVMTRLEAAAAYRSLEGGAARLHRLLSVLPGTDFGIGAARAAAASDAETTRTLLGELAAAGLLQNAGDDRYRHGNAAAGHAITVADRLESAPDRAAARTRVLNWYAVTAAAACYAVTPHREVVAVLAGDATGDTRFSCAGAGLAWLELEFANLVAAVRVAWTHRQWTLTMDLAESLPPVFECRGYDTKTEAATYSYALRAARRIEDQAAAHRWYWRYGVALARAGRHDEARDQIELFRKLWSQNRDELILADALAGSAYLAAACGEHDEAIDSYTDALARYGSFGDRWRTAYAWMGLAESLLAVGRAGEALTVLPAACHILGDGDDQFRHWRTHILMGRAFTTLAEYDAAGCHLDKALSQMTELGAVAGEIAALEALAELAAATGDHRAAHDRCGRALVLLDRFAESRRARQAIERLNRLTATAPVTDDTAG